MLTKRALRFPLDGQPQMLFTNMQVGEGSIVALIDGQFDLAIRQVLAMAYLGQWELR